ncbi:hypothetical protein [Mucilaginibacter sp. HD30]
MNLTGNTRLKILLAIMSLVFTAGCGNVATQQQASTDTTQALLAESPPAEAPKSPPDAGDCKATETLIYSDAGTSSYTEDKIRGVGVISFQFEVNDRLDIYNEDGSQFGFLVYNEGYSFYMLDMPAKIIARAVVPVDDFMQFDFDAEAIGTDKDYLIIYVNKEKRKVKKASLRCTFSKWDDYLKNNKIRLKGCNRLPAAGSNNDLIYEVLQLKGDQIKIKSVKNCSGEDEGFKQVEGWIKWKNADLLTVDLASCN